MDSSSCCCRCCCRVTGVVEAFELIILLGVTAEFVERDRLGNIFQYRIVFECLIDDLAQLHASRLKDLQALAHLGRKRLSLRKILLEEGLGHGRCK